jgi:microcystin-dependent protein
MTADSYTSILGMIAQFTGNNNNSWGDTFNNSFGAIIERAVAGIATHADTGGTLDLSASPPPAGPSGALDYIQRFTGTLTSNLTVTMPNLKKSWIIDNATNGSFSLLIKASAGGTAVEIPQGVSRLVWCDGAASIRREDADQVGTFRYSGCATNQPGGFACNGASLLRADHPDLFAKIGTTWGTVDGTHFTLPDLQTAGRFLRSSSGSLTVGTYQSNQNKSHTHTGSGTTGVESADHTHVTSISGTTGAMSANASHTHTVSGATIGGNTSGLSGGSTTGTPVNSTAIVIDAKNTDHTHTFSGSGTSSGINTNHTHAYSFTTSTGSADGTEARPESAVAYVSILY